jgi:hypothetical protein
MNEDLGEVLLANLEMQQKNKGDHWYRKTDKWRLQALTYSILHRHVHHHNPPGTPWVFWLLAPDPLPLISLVLSPSHVPLPCDVLLPPSLAVAPTNANSIRYFSWRNQGDLRSPLTQSPRQHNISYMYKLALAIIQPSVWPDAFNVVNWFRNVHQFKTLNYVYQYWYKQNQMKSLWPVFMIM